MRAMILAAGRGKRLRPITDGCPKPLIKVNQKPLIVYHLEALKRAGIREVVINVCHLADQIMRMLGDGSAYGLSIQYSDERGMQLETGGGIKKALPLLGSEPFLLVNGDIFCDYPFNKISPPTHEAHLIMVPNPEHHLEGDFGFAHKQLQKKTSDKPSYTYAGIACFKPSFFNNLQSDAIPLSPLIYQGILNQCVTGEVYQGYWMDVGTVERLQALEHYVKGQTKLKKVNESI